MENKPITRREALKTLFGTGAVLFTSGLFGGFGDELLAKKRSQYSEQDIFFIQRVAEAIKKYRFNPELDAPSENASYTLQIIVAKNPINQGRLSFSRTDGGLSVNVFRKNSLGYHQYIDILEKTGDGLSDVISWTYHTTMTDRPAGKGSTLHGIPVEGKGSVGPDIVIEENGGENSYPTACPRTLLSWNMFFAAEEVWKTREVQEYDVVDEYDIYAGLRRFEPFKDAFLEIDGLRHRLHGVLATGYRTLPWFFWFDDDGHLLFANSGLSIYVRE